jgi:hypothetical protein
MIPLEEGGIIKKNLQYNSVKEIQIKILKQLEAKGLF